jgi:hypothetical protein
MVRALGDSTLLIGGIIDSPSPQQNPGALHSLRELHCGIIDRAWLGRLAEACRRRPPCEEAKTINALAR